MQNACSCPCSLPAVCAALQPPRRPSSCRTPGSSAATAAGTTSPSIISAHLLYIARLDRVMVVDTQTGKLAHRNHRSHPRPRHRLRRPGKGGLHHRWRRRLCPRLRPLDLPRSWPPSPPERTPTPSSTSPHSGASSSSTAVSHDATVIDAATNKVVRTIPMPGKPEFSVTDGRGQRVRQHRRHQQRRAHRCRRPEAHRHLATGSCQRSFGLAIDTRTPSPVLRLR